MNENLSTLELQELDDMTTWPGIRPAGREGLKRLLSFYREHKLPKSSAPIDQEWINAYVGALLGVASRYPKPGPNQALDPMAAAALTRAEHAMDLVEAWRKR